MLAIIPARGGSRRIPRKNIRPFFGKPIIAYAIDLAKQAGVFKDVFVSTDDDEIASIALNYGARVICRNPDDGSRGTQDVAAEVIEKTGHEGLACVIYPTTPLLEPMDIIRGLHAVQRAGVLYSFGVGTEPLMDAGGFYWGRSWAFKDRVPLLDSGTVMVPLPSNRVCDINTEEDWRQCEQMYARLHHKCCGHIHHPDAIGYCVDCPDVRNAQMLNQRGNM